MSGLITQLEDLLTDFVLICTMLMEIIGVCVLVQTAVKCFIRLSFNQFSTINP